MFRSIIVALGIFFISSIAGQAAETKAKAEFTQRDFARLLIDHFSWSAGLPEEKTDRDYLLILGGKRTFRYEAENAYNPETDRVTLREYPLFGTFTGKGWLMGVSDTTSATFTLLLPIQGEYTLKAVVKGNGFVWNVNSKDYRVDSKSANFKEIEVGKISLKAGILTINVSIPPEGAIDSFSFVAADHQPIQPLVGWRFKENLNAGRLAEIVVSMTSRFAELPESKESSLKSLSVADVATIPATAGKTGITYLGKFTSSEWIRADFRGANIQIPFKVPDTGYYSVVTNVMGEKIKGSINENRFEVPGKPYLEMTNLGLYRLDSGDNMITVDLLPMGGIDTLNFNKKSTMPDDFLKLAGIKGPAERLITADEATALLKSIQTSYKIRK